MALPPVQLELQSWAEAAAPTTKHLPASSSPLDPLDYCIQLHTTLQTPKQHSTCRLLMAKILLSSQLQALTASVPRKATA